MHAITSVNKRQIHITMATTAVFPRSDDVLVMVLVVVGGKIVANGSGDMNCEGGGGNGRGRGGGRGGGGRGAWVVVVRVCMNAWVRGCVDGLLGVNNYSFGRWVATAKIVVDTGGPDDKARGTGRPTHTPAPHVHVQTPLILVEATFLAMGSSKKPPQLRGPQRPRVRNPTSAGALAAPRACFAFCPLLLCLFLLLLTFAPN